jgi:hypothetical protein
MLFSKSKHEIRKTVYDYPLHSRAMKDFIKKETYSRETSLNSAELMDICVRHFITKAKAVPRYAMKTFGGEDVQLLLILNLGLDGGEWSASRPVPRYSPGESTPLPNG